MFFCKGPVESFEQAQTSDTAKFARFHRGMLEEGVYLAPSQVGCLEKYSSRSRWFHRDVFLPRRTCM